MLDYGKFSNYAQSLYKICVDYEVFGMDWFARMCVSVCVLS